jgi:hypothetical protein
MPTLASSDDVEGAVGMTLASFVPDQRIRQRAAMDGKASKYGELGKPLILVLDATEFQWDRDLMTPLSRFEASLDNDVVAPPSRRSAW